MKFITSVLFGALAPAALASDKATSSMLRNGARALTAPDPNGSMIKKCILVNLQTLHELVLDGSDEYDFAQAGIKGWSVKCFSEVNKSVDYVKFFFDGTDETQYYSPERFVTPDLQPFWMRGDNRGADVNAVSYLGSGGAKKFTVKFYTWPGGDDFPSGQMTYHLNPISKCASVTCPPDSTCDEATGKCNCNAGLTLKNGVCVPIDKCALITCPPNSTCDAATGSCNCNFGLVKQNGVCVPIDKCAGVQCPPGSRCDGNTGACVCTNTNNVLVNGSCKCNLQKSGIYGKPNGHPFDHTLEIGECPVVREAAFRSGRYVDRVGFLLTNGQWLDDGGNGGDHRGLHLGHGEYVQQVKVCNDAHEGAIIYIKYTTNKHRIVEGGKHNGICEHFNAPFGKAVVGFHGTFTHLITSLGVVYAPAPVLY